MQQLGLDFGAGAVLAASRDELRATFGAYAPASPRTPVGQLVKSMLSSRTYDAVSLAAYARLTSRFPDWTDLAAATVEEIETVIADVRWPERKAPQVIAALRRLGEEHPAYDLDFLGDWPVATALAWLESLLGVGRKISASTLNFSTLQRPALVVDTHVLRVFKRMRLIGARADIAAAYDQVMPGIACWSVVELQELHVLVKRLGQTVCRHACPDCAACPLTSICRYPPFGGG